MMFGEKLIGLISFVQAVGLLTVSFFVLVAARKLDSPGLKTFGFVVAVLLWAAAALVFGAGVYKMASGDSCRRGEMMQRMMQQGQMPMMQRQMPSDK